MSNLINIQSKEGQLLVSSREVSKNFEKRHDHVLRDLDDIKNGVTQNWGDLFCETSYTHEQNKQEYREILMNRDGFTLLAMGFTGKKALEWKLKYIEAFNKMEQELREQTPAIDSKFMFQIAAQIERQEREIGTLQLATKKQEQVIGELKPKADYMDNILQNKGLVTITQIAHDYGLSGQAMNNLLHELGIQYKQSGQWLLYSKHQGKGYTHSKTIDIVRSDGTPDIKMNTKWTQKGRLFLYELLKENGYLPTIEKDFPKKQLQGR